MNEPVPRHPEIERIVAPNPGPLTLEGTNTWIVADGERAWAIDPGPADSGHIAAVVEAAGRRGDLAAVLLTHSHSDHSAAAPELEVPLAWGTVGSTDETASESGPGAVDDGWPPQPPEGPIGPFAVVPTPGHSVDHVAFLLGGACFCGDLVLGAGSSFVPPDGGSLAAYLESLERLRQLEIDVLCPGHGPVVTDPAAKLDEYIEHRLDRERRVLAALAAGVGSRAELLDRAWDDVPSELRPAATLVMQAHLEKLEAEGRIAAGLLAD